MSETLRRVVALLQRGETRVSEHGYDEMAQDGITAREVVSGVDSAVVIEEYPDYPKGPCVLVLQQDNEGKPIHVVWGIPSGRRSPAVIVTAFRPDPERWVSDCTRRRK